MNFINAILHKLFKVPNKTRLIASIPIFIVMYYYFNSIRKALIFVSIYITIALIFRKNNIETLSTKNDPEERYYIGIIENTGSGCNILPPNARLAKLEQIKTQGNTSYNARMLGVYNDSDVVNNNKVN